MKPSSHRGIESDACEARIKYVHIAPGASGYLIYCIKGLKSRACCLVHIALSTASLVPASRQILYGKDNTMNSGGEPC